MLTRPAKLIISFSLSILAIVLFLIFKGEQRKKCMYAMLLCTVGDVFMVNTFNLGSFNTYIGAAFFMAAHVIYGLCFLQSSKAKNYKIANKGFVIGIIISGLAAIVLGILAFTIPSEPQIVMYMLILIYLSIIAFNLVSQFSYAVAEGKIRKLLIVAMSLFLISDFVIFLSMLYITPEYNDFVWATYAPAQLLIILFNSNFQKSL